MANSKKCSQNTIIILCWLVYTFAYFGRYSYNANISLIMEDFNINHATAGIVTTCFFFAYGIGQVVNGMLCEKYNKKIIFPTVLFLSSVLNLLALVIPFEYFKYLWLLNGFLQAVLWPSIINVLGDYLDSDHLSRALVILGTSATAGTILVYSGSALFVWMGNYHTVFCVAAALMSFVGVLWLFIFNPGEKRKAEIEKEEHDGKSDGVKAIFIMLAMLAFFAVVNNLVKDGLSTWVPAILTEDYNMQDEVAILSSVVLPLLGSLGAMLAVRLNKYIKDFVKLSSALYAVSAIVLAGIMVLGEKSAVILIICFGIMQCLMHGVNSVVTFIGPLKLRDKVNSGKIAGILNGFCYLGSTISSYGLGLIADNSGWQSVFLLLLVLCAVCVVPGALFWKKD